MSKIDPIIAEFTRLCAELSDIRDAMQTEINRLRARVVELEQAAYADSYVRGALEHVQEMWHRAEKEFALDANDPYEAIASLRAELAKLSDPNAVQLNLLNGRIAKPSIDQIKHIYPDIAEALASHRWQLIETAPKDTQL